MGDGSEEEFVPVDVGYVPPAHNSWVVGNESVGSFLKWVVGNESGGSFLKCRFDIISLPLFFFPLVLVATKVNWLNYSILLYLSPSGWLSATQISFRG